MNSTLLAAVILVASAGFVESHAFMTYGQVFTSAITGNFVLLGVDATEGHWPKGLVHIAPILAFFLGVFSAQVLDSRLASHGMVNPATVSLGIQVVVLATIAALPSGVPFMPIVFSIAFVAAMQNSTFKKLEKWSFTSVVTTGNGRAFMEAFYTGIFPKHDPDMARKARLFGALVASYAGGAVLGAFATAAFSKRAIGLPICLLIVALVLFLRQERTSTLTEPRRERPEG